MPSTELNLKEAKTSNVEGEQTQRLSLPCGVILRY